MKKVPYTVHRFTDIVVNRNQLMKLLKSEVISITKTQSQASHSWNKSSPHYKFLGYKLTCNIEIPTKYATEECNGWCLFLDTALENYLILEENKVDDSFWSIKEIIKTKRAKK